MSRSGQLRKWEAGLWAQAEVILSLREDKDKEDGLNVKVNPMEIARANKLNAINRLFNPIFDESHSSGLFIEIYLCSVEI